MTSKRHSYHSGNSNVLGALCQELETKTKYIFLIIPHCYYIKLDLVLRAEGWIQNITIEFPLGHWYVSLLGHSATVLILANVNNICFEILRWNVPLKQLNTIFLRGIYQISVLFLFLPRLLCSDGCILILWQSSFFSVMWQKQVIFLTG